MRAIRYELGARLAVGGMAEVFLATARSGDDETSTVVVKRILPQFCEDPTFIQMFFDEATITARLDHPNIVRLVDMGRLDDQLFLALEFIDGMDLEELVLAVRERGEKLPFSIAALVVADALSGLHHAHTRTTPDGRPLKIIHRDVTPRNVLIGLDGTAKISDFGIAKAAVRHSGTQAGVIKGNFQYLSPEAVSGEPIDARADVYGAGMVLRVLLTGQPPVDSDSLPTMIDRVLRGDFPPLATAAPDTPAALDAIVRQATAIRPSDRFATADDFRRALMACARECGETADAGDLAAWVAACRKDRDDVRLLGNSGIVMSRTGAGDLGRSVFSTNVTARSELPTKAVETGFEDDGDTSRTLVSPGSPEAAPPPRPLPPPPLFVPVPAPPAPAGGPRPPPPAGGPPPPVFRAAAAPAVAPAPVAPPVANPDTSWADERTEINPVLRAKAVAAAFPVTDPTVENPRPLREPAQPNLSRDAPAEDTPPRPTPTPARAAASAVALAFADAPLPASLSETPSIRLPGHRQSVSAVAFGGPSTLVSAGNDQLVRIWNLDTTTETASLRGHTGAVTSVAVGPGGVVISGSRDKSARIWRLGTNACERVLTGHSGWVFAVALSDDGLFAASGGVDKTIRLWDVGTGAELRTLSGHTDTVSSIAFLPDGRLISASYDQTIRLWSLDGAIERTCGGAGSGSMRAVAVSPDSICAVSAGADGPLRVWDLESGASAGVLGKHEGPVVALAFVPGTALIASASYDGSVRLWNLARRTEVSRLDLGGSVTALAAAPGGGFLAMGNGDGSLALWAPG